MLGANASRLAFFFQADPEVPDFTRSRAAGGDITGLINDEFLKDRLQSVSRQKIAHSSHDECYPPHTLHLTQGKMDSLPCCYFSSIFFKQRA